jgi:paraquat-inducible protein A
MNPELFSFRCPLCDQRHKARPLRRGQRAQCVRCGTTMAERGWIGTNAAVAFALTGLALTLPALWLPFVSLQQFGRLRVTHLTVGFTGFWSHGFSSLGAWVLFCGVLAPVALLVLLVLIFATDRREPWEPLNHGLRRLAAFIQYWAMPEVQVLGVMVAFLKLGSIVTLNVGPGLWCYAVVSICMLAAWRRFNLAPVIDRAESTEGLT